VSLGDEEATLRHASSLSLERPIDSSPMSRVCARDGEAVHSRASGAVRKEVMLWP